MKKPTANDGLSIWWPGAESNHRHKDFQSSALPTELPGLASNYSISSGAISLAAAQIDSQLFELAIQVGSLQSGLFGNPGHGSVFLG
jgi:hypothetical protein